MVGYPHDVKGQGIYAFVICKEVPEREDYLRAEIIETVVEKIGKVRTDSGDRPAEPITMDITIA